MEQWSNGVLEYWSIGVLEYWSIGVVVLQNNLGLRGIGLRQVDFFRVYHSR
jgi:hypothetical protein